MKTGRILVALLTILMAKVAFTQDVTLRFSGAMNDGGYLRLDSVLVENLTRSWSETLLYPDTVLTFSSSSITDAVGGAPALKCYPNPFKGTTTVSVAVTENCHATLRLYNLAGKLLAEKSQELAVGENVFRVSLRNTQVAMLAVGTQKGQSTVKLLNGTSASENAISFSNYSRIFEKRLSSNPFQPGDRMRYTGYATAGGAFTVSVPVEQVQNGSGNVPLSFSVTVPVGALCGLFAVSDSTRVFFSRGNLQYTTTGVHAVAGGGTARGTWRFAPNQWDTIGYDNKYIDSAYTGWIDLFNWATSGYHDPNDPYNINYQPYSWDYNHPTGNLSLNWHGYGPSYNMPDTSLIGTSSNYDWGVYNAISNGGNAPCMWRTLTKAEWDYLLFTRITASGIRYAKATVNGMTGLVIVPESWNPENRAFNSPNVSSAPYTSNVFTATRWDTLENAGCAFLPAAGCRQGDTVRIVGPGDTLRGQLVDWVGLHGMYWSSSCYSSCCAYYIVFFIGYLQHHYFYREYGSSVRLVKDL